jgi:hypothetical protein
VATASLVAPTPGPGEPTPGPGEPTPGPGEPTPGPVPTPTSDSPPALAGSLLRNETLGYSFEYHGDHWVLGDSGGIEGRTVLNGVFFDAQVVIDVAPATVSTAEMIASQLAFADRFTLGRAPDTDSYDALLGPSIGYIRGEGGVYSGTLLDRDGTPVEPVGITVLASTNGRITVGVIVIAGQPDARLGPDTHQYAVRASTDLVLKTFNWGPTL